MGQDRDALVAEDGSFVLQPVGSWDACPADPSGYGIRVSSEHARMIAALPDLVFSCKAALENWGPREVFLLPEEKAALLLIRNALDKAGVM